jgi:hypothetical protein
VQKVIVLNNKSKKSNSPKIIVPQIESAFFTDKNYGLDKALKFILILILCIAPLPVHIKPQVLYSPIIDQLIYFKTGLVADYFSYYKSVLLYILCVLALVLLIIRLFAEKITLRSTVLNMCLAVFTSSLIISTLLSDYKVISLWGGYNRNMGALSFLCFAFILFLVINLSFNYKWHRLIMNSLYIVLFINFFLTILTFYGTDILDMKLVKWLLIGGYGDDAIGTGSRFFGTFSHANYLSGFGAFLFAAFSARYIFGVHSRATAASALIFAFLSAAIIYASESLSGIVTFFFVVFSLFGIFIVDKDKKKAIRLTVLMLIIAGIWIIMALYDSSFLREIIQNEGLIIASAMSSLIVILPYLVLRKKEGLLRGISGHKLRIIVSLTCVVLIFILVITAIMITPKISEQIAMTDSEVINEQLSQDAFALPEPGVAWGSGRIYIWKETLELAAQRPLFGYGFDTLPFELDQGDPAKIAALESPDVIIDKPHNMYIHMLYGAGGLAFIAYLAIIAIVIWNALRTMSSLNKGHSSVLIWPYLFGILAYLYQGIFNDPVHGFEPIFWIFLGLAYNLSTYGIEDPTVQS